MADNGMTQKEMLLLVLEGQDKINERIDSLHEKVNAKISRQELAGWVVVLGTLSAITTQM
jgi:hypothetical protein|tara:strand:- start:3039 stop:3218 length:180 start_codon:yes stop_codon:yes gene_type:complete